jgi:hypothetical protein
MPRPTGPGPVGTPPFWELEDLIAQGRTCEQALAIMISRRNGVLEALPERSREIACDPSDQDALPRTALSA